MRYHRAKALSKPEADWLIGRQVAALSDVVVISRGAKFYDVRAMTDAEVRAFVADLTRAEYEELQAAAMPPS